MIFNERDGDAWTGTIGFNDDLLALEFLLKIVNLKGHMRHGHDELRIRRIWLVPHPLDVVEALFVTTDINFQMLQMHFPLSFFGGWNSEMMVRPHSKYSSEGLKPVCCKALQNVKPRFATTAPKNLREELWHIMMGHAIGTLERLDTLQTKLSKFATEIGSAALAAFGYTNKTDFVQKKLYVLRNCP
jgi:hypothetical protein